MVGDAACQSGFSRGTHALLDVARHHYDVAVLGINYLGEPHPYPYPIYPAFSGGDAFGIRRIGPLAKTLQPDVIVIQNDPWNFPAYLRPLAEYAPGVPVIGIVAVDGLNCRGYALNGLRAAIFWTQFGANMAWSGGYQGTAAVIPLGVDLETYQPRDQKIARARLKLPPALRDAFIVGNLNRNQQRKRLDLTLEYFARWVSDYRVDNAYLFLHVAPTGDANGYDCEQLAKYYGISDRLLLSEPAVRLGPSDDAVAHMYSALDVQVTTSQGEGWGLCTMEGMACGVPQVVPKWAALAEWAADAALMVDCTATSVTPDRINSVGGVADCGQFVQALDLLYRDAQLRRALSGRGLDLVQRPQYRWSAIGQQFVDTLAVALQDEPVHA